MGSQFNTIPWGGGAPIGTVPVTATSLGYGALRLLGVLRPGAAGNADSYDDILRWLNELLDSWAIESLMVKVIARASIAMDGSASYLSDFPHRIEGATYAPGDGAIESPLRIYVPGEWPGIGTKGSVGTPAGIYPEYTPSRVTLYPWPQPASGVLYTYQWQPIEAFADLATPYTMPAGYALALRYCLAAQIAPAFLIITKIPQALLGSIEEKAREYKGRIKSLNCAPRLMVSDVPRSSGGRYDIRSGGYR